jgi:hypothetical protein
MQAKHPGISAERASTCLPPSLKTPKLTPVTVLKPLSSMTTAILKPYEHPPDTKEDLPWAELVTLDLEDYDRPGGKERLAKQLEHAVHHVGFFYVKNYGLSQEQVDQQFTLANNFFELPIEEKEKYEIKYSEADYNGWRRSGRQLQANAFDNVEIFNIPKYALRRLPSSSLHHLIHDYITYNQIDSHPTSWGNTTTQTSSRRTSTR